MNKIEKLYQDLHTKYGKPEGQWILWCKRPKTKANKEKIVIGAILTQNTNWKNVDLAMANLKKEKVCSLAGICRLENKKLESLIKPSGFYKTKAGYLFGLAKFILDKGGFERLRKIETAFLREELLKQRGVGPETADSILLYALEKPIFVVDEYTRRLVKKHKLSKDLSYNSLQDLFQKNLKEDCVFYQDFHALIVIEGKSRD